MNWSRGTRVGVAGLALAAAVACGRSSAPSKAPSSASPSQTVPAAATAPAPGPPATAGEARIVRPVAFERLVELLPEIEGWMRATPRGEETPISGGTIAHARAIYEKGGRQVELEITDSGFNPLVLSPLAMSLAPTYAERYDQGYRKAAPVAGHPGFEEWHGEIHRAELTVVVAGRFVVGASGTNMDSVDPVRAIVQAVDMSRLSSLK